MDKEELQERSLAFAVDIKTKVCDLLNTNPAARETSSQLLDCSTSMAANYRAACRGRSRAEFISKLGTVVEESDESVYWLEFIDRSGLLPAGDVAALLDEAQQLRAIFAKSYGTARANHQQQKRRKRRP